MKLQDVVAQVLAFFKGILSISMYFVVSYSLYNLGYEMIDGHFEVNKSYKLHKADATIHVQEAEKVDTIVEISKENIKKADEEQRISEKVGFFCYIFSGCCRKNIQLKGQIEFYRLARDYIDERLDVMNILMLTDKFERLVEMTLSEEQQIELQRKHSANKHN